MDLSDSREISADRATVWAALLSADVLRDCVPGCKEMTGTPDDGFEAVVVQKVGPVKATFKGKVTLSDIVSGEALTLTGEGQGGAAGFAKGGARVRLEDGEAGGTRLIYDVEAKVGGKLAQLGNRIIHGVARKMAEQFFARFQAAVEETDTDEPGPAGAETAAGRDEESDGTAKKKGWFKRLIAR